MSLRSLHDDYLLTCPTMQRQSFCSRCGKGGPVELHHPVNRSRGGGGGPVIALCAKCHHRHHSISPFEFDYRDGAWWADGKRLIEE